MKFIYSLCAFIFLGNYAFCQVCGVPSTRSSLTKIVNGDRSVPYSWPWIVSLRRSTSRSHFCGGSLIDSTTVVTAAHCVDGLSASSLFVVAGIYYLKETLVNSVNTFNVKEIRRNSAYSSLFKTNDIAIIKLTTAVTFSNKIQPICLPPSITVNVVYNKILTIAGWGSTIGTPGQQVASNTLLNTNLTVITDSVKCQGNEIRNYCAIDLTSKKSNTCQGDSGGPLMYYMNKKYYLYGLLSFGFGDSTNYCINTSPSFYTVVPNYLIWIAQNRK